MSDAFPSEGGGPGGAELSVGRKRRQLNCLDGPRVWQATRLGEYSPQQNKGLAMERKLTAIVAMDVVGFAGLVSDDEQGALERLERLKEDVVRLQVEAHRGRVFKSMGDGFLAEFSSTVEAVNCAIGVQRAVRRAGDLPNEPPPLTLRIGVSLGDVIVQGDDLLGDGVNAASRLEAMAEPGGLAVSAEVMAQIRGKIDVPLEDQGYKRLKRSDAPIHVYMTRSKSIADGGVFDFEEDALAVERITGGCICGEIRFEISAPAISTGYCHCRICQKFAGSAMSTWTAFPKSAVSFGAPEPTYFGTSPIAERGFCSTCGASISYRLLQPKEAAHIVIFTPSLDHPEDYAPVAHSGVETKLPWLEIFDDLPRTETRDSRVLQQAWSSVGLPDPDSWGAMAAPPAVF